MVKWGVSSYLVTFRSFQVLSTLICAILNGFLLVYINLNRLGLTDAMFALEIMTCITLIYTAVVLLIQHTGRRYLKARGAWVTIFVGGDLLFTGLNIGVITVLAGSGVPSNCAGLTRSNYDEGDAPNNPPQGYQTIRFGTGSPGDRGVLDKFCSLEQAYYFLTVILIFTYMATVTLSILRIFLNMYTKNSLIRDELAGKNDLYRTESKLSTTQRSISLAHVSEGVMSPSPSTGRPVSEHELMPLPQTSAAALPHAAASIPPATLAVAPAATTAAAVPYTQSATSYAPSLASFSVSPVSPVSPITTTTPTPTQPPSLSLNLGSESFISDDADSVAEEAAAALISDGYRGPGSQNGGYQYAGPHGSMPVLPPYTPGEAARFMVGHAGESNEMRLSDYVKGQTRAQNEKDNGGM
ncbi:hypothetical protein BX600DRAFT_511301 [Xylariales sp. PMI_506]|nr:hypothetical protein BX600DRAFT_511301 [Xylariales sp. PMI_506]